MSIKNKIKESLSAITSRGKNFTFNYDDDNDNSSEASKLKEKSGVEDNFSSSIGIIMSCLGCVVGTGNIWRFPRICAQNSDGKGSLVFLLVWISFLVLWSMPIIIIEYTLGRFSKCGPLMTFTKFLGEKFIWTGLWCVSVTLLIASYYNVVVGWCAYYFYKACELKQLPRSEESSQYIFDHFTEETWWPVFYHFVVLLLVGVCIFGGIQWIEKANCVLVPALLFIIVFTFAWSLTRDYAEIGISFLFTAQWSSLGDPSLWIAAASQNAFDTGAGSGLFAAYSAYFTRANGSVRYGSTIPVLNNLVSLVCAVTIFSTVFSTLTVDNPTLTRVEILEIMQKTGPGSTGLTFTWIPVLFSRVGVFGRILCGLFFLCLTMAGMTSMISNIQLASQTLSNFGVSLKVSNVISLVVLFVVGLPSAIKIDLLTNQDAAWSYALIISGLMFSLLLILYGPMKFRKIVVNDFGIGDWPLLITWLPVMVVVVPFEAALLILWWVYDSVTNTHNWHIPSYESLSAVLIEWSILVVILGIINLLVIKFGQSFLEKCKKTGYDPHNPSYVPQNVIQTNDLGEIKIHDESFDKTQM